MKKILGLTAMVLLLAGPVFADNSVINYTLEIGGDNHAGQYENSVERPQFTPGGSSTITVPAGGTVTWDVKVDVGGTVNVGGVDYACSGAANLVWTLELRDSANALVAVGAAGIACDSGTVDVDCLNAHPTSGGFYSTIQDGDKDGLGTMDKRKLAAFAFSFQADGSGAYARVWDAQDSNGPDMARYQYPSAAGFPDLSTAPQGKLVGMGAGYTQFAGSFAGGTQTGGVGLTSGECSTLLGTGPVAEGQISTIGLPAGTYTLTIVPGAGNNVLSLESCTGGGSGRFAAAGTTVGTTVNGSQVQFVVEAVPPGTLTVNILPAGAVTAGAQWNVNGGAWNNSGAAVSVPAGSYTVSFKDVAGYTKPADITDTMASGANVTKTGTYVAQQLPAPVLTSAESVKTHATIATPLRLALNRSGTVTSESRNGGPSQIVLTYDQNIGGTINVVPTGATLNGAPVVAGATLTINLNAVTDKTCVALAVSGVTDATGTSLAASNTVKVRARRGDVNNDGQVNSADVLAVKQKNSFANVTNLTCMYDLNLSGKCGSDDTLLCKQLNVFGSTTCNYP